jgi:predicted DNA-binding ribbon-helix-helix protein
MSNSKVTTTTKLEEDMWLTQMALDRSLQRSLLVEKVILEKFDELTNLLSYKVEEQLTLAMIIALNKKQRT